MLAMLLLADAPAWVTDYPISAVLAGLLLLVIGAEVLVAREPQGPAPGRGAHNDDDNSEGVLGALFDAALKARPALS